MDARSSAGGNDDDGNDAHPGWDADAYAGQPGWPANPPAVPHRGRASPPSKPKRTTPLWVTILVGIVALLIGIAAGGSRKAQQNTAAPAAVGAATVYVTVTEPAPSQTAPSAVASDASAAATAAATTKATTAASASKPAVSKTSTSRAPVATTTKPVPSRTRPPTTAPPAPAKKVVLSLSGNGIKTSPNFTVGPDWSLAYTFDCSSFGMKGNFQVYENGGAGSVLANALADKGSDKTYQHADGGTHSLEMNSECDWTITVTDADGG